MNILIDADGCPVVELTLQIAKRFCVPVIILCDTSHQIEREGAQTLVFDGTWWKIEGISPLCQKIRTIEFTLKISSRSQITRLCADLNPLSKTQKNQPFGENWERFYARWRERAREIPGAKIHPYNMLPSDADQIKAAKDG